MSARALGFLGLMLGLPARAGVPIAEVAVDPEPAAPTLSARWDVEVRGGRAFVSLKIKNGGDGAVDIMVARGTLPGASLGAFVDGSPLEEVVSGADKVQYMSRMGPTPRYAVLAATDEVEVGDWVFELAPGQDVGALVLEASVWAGSTRTSFSWVGTAKTGPQA